MHLYFLQGFRKVDPDRWEFANEGFLRGQKHLLKSIVRRKPAHGHNHQPEVHSSSVGACVEVGKFGLEEEVERLKRDKNILMQELVRLRQQQQNTEHQLQNVGQKVQVMEQRQQQMMSFLAKAMQSPGFLNQLVQQQSESNRRIAGGNKKRRLPRQDKENPSGHGVGCPNGQIIKYKPSINEAAKAMLHQISKLNTSARLESSVNNPASFLINDIPSSSVLENGSSLNGVSGVTLSEVPPISAQSFMSTESRFPASCIATSVSELQSSPHMVTDSPKAGQIPEMNVHHSRDEIVLPGSTQMQDNMLGTTIGASDTNFMVSEAGNPEYMDRISAVLDGTDAIETDFVSEDHDLAIFLDGATQLPGINDAFWEQFLAASPLPVDTDEISPTSSESVTMKYQLQSSENGWDKIQHINHLTDKMSLLTSESQKG